MTDSDDRARRARAEVEDAGFLKRWSRRKSAERAADAAPPPSANAAGGDDAGPASADAPDARPAAAPIELTDADMPPLDSLDEDSDYSPFLSPKVSEGLRRAALRRLFASAKFNVVDGLDDYAEDFRAVEPLVGALADRLLDRGPARADPDPADPADGSPPAADAAARTGAAAASREAEHARDDDPARGALADADREAAPDGARPGPDRG